MNQPIFIIGPHKSGTSLLRSLLDGHPDLFAIPIETHIFRNLNYWVEYPYRHNLPGESNLAGWKSRVRDLVASYQDRDDRQADSALSGRFDMDRFDARLERIGEGEAGADRRNWVHGLFEALHLALMGKAPEEGCRFVEKSVTNAEFVPDLLALFPDARFLHIVRNPYANLVSIRKYKGKKRFPPLQRGVEAIRQNAYGLYRNARIAPHYHVLRYEDLVRDPEVAMREVAHFLNLDWAPSLTQPTLLGESWQGNSTSGRLFSCISETELQRWEEQITPLEECLVNKHLQFVLTDLGYPVRSCGKAGFRPARGESLRVYMRNRYLLQTHVK